MQGGPDYIVLKSLDTDSIRIIGSVLGQSIALDYFVSQVKYYLYQSNVLGPKISFFMEMYCFFIPPCCFKDTFFQYDIIFSSNQEVHRYELNACHFAWKFNLHCLNNIVSLCLDVSLPDNLDG